MGDALKRLPEFARRTAEPRLVRAIAYFIKNPLDPHMHPASTAVIGVFVRRMVDYLLVLYNDAPTSDEKSAAESLLFPEMEELEKWIKEPASRDSFPQEERDELGDWLVAEVGYTYTRARKFIDMLVGFSGKARGAPSKRPQTLKLLDARLANGWSYGTLAREMCDCGAARHTEHCSERIRKRIKEAEAFLAKYGITPATPEKNDEAFTSGRRLEVND